MSWLDWARLLRASLSSLRKGVSPSSSFGKRSSREGSICWRGSNPLRSSGMIVSLLMRLG